MLLAERLARGEGVSAHGGTHNVRIIFTDGEEAAGTKGVAGQGAYALGSGFRKLKMTDDDVYVLDATGRGDVLVLSTACVSKKKPGWSSTRGSRPFTSRRQKSRKRPSPSSWMTLHTPLQRRRGISRCGNRGTGGYRAPARGSRNAYPRNRGRKARG